MSNYNNTEITATILKDLISNSTLATLEKNKRAAPLLPSGGGLALNGYNALAIAYMLILQAVNTSSHTAVISAKELNSNALAQLQLNEQDEREPRFTIPKEKIQHYLANKRTKHTKWEITHTPGGSWQPTNKVYWTRKMKSRVVNQTQIDQAKAQNQEVAKQRQGIENKLRVLQQSAQLDETHVNTLIGESVQTMQEGVQIMTILRSLTFKALLRQAPSA